MAARELYPAAMRQHDNLRHPKGGLMSGRMSETAEINLVGNRVQTQAGKRDEIIIFLHLPKCGGTTLNRLIEWEYNPLRVFSIDPSFFQWSFSRLWKTPVSRLRKIEVFKGHMPFGLHERLEKPATYITVLRDPVDRAISAYYYMRSRRLNPQHSMAMRYTLEEFVRNTRNHNVQTKMLAGHDRSYDFIGGDCDESTLHAAMRNLSERFSLVGLTERFDEALAIAKIRFGWKVNQYAEFNVTGERPRRDAIAPATREMIAERHRFDVELYRHATTLFDRAAMQEGERLREGLEEIRQAKSLGAVGSSSYRIASAARKAISRAHSALLTL